MPLWTEEHEQRLDEVLAGYLQALKEGAAPGRQELLDSHPELAGDLAAFFADQDRFDRLAAPLRGMVPASERLNNLRKFGDYEILEEIARGGMGVVFKAWQKSLGRVVALKMLLAGPWASSADLQRFRAEAEAAAQLDHPNIVPIHEVGTHDGHPYLSMKLVEGGSLAHRLATVERDPSDREAADLLATVADAIHYAHQHGILHRDLKPANILLQKRETTNHTNHTNKKTTEKKTPYGLAKKRNSASSFHSSDSCDSWLNVFPLLTDFGLAKRAPQADRSGDSSSRIVPSEVPTLPLPPALTHTGAILGTPGYMAPEQASGSPASVAADVYGLGAILYEMLTGRPPFQGATLLDTVRQVLEQEPVRPSEYRPAIDRDLETICLKCLQKEPYKRYASARELADDLRRFLRGEAILARPIGSLGRAWRLARRRPLVSALTAALAVALIGGLSSALALWQRAEDHARIVERQRDELAHAWHESDTHRRDAEHHLEEAEKNFRLAHEAVHNYCRRVSEEMRDTPALQPLRKKLLENALQYYKDFLARRGQDPALRRELAETYAQTARLTMDLGSRSDTRDAFRQAAELYSQLQAEDADNLELQRKLGEILNSRAIFEDSAEAALKRLDEARDTYLRFLDTHPRDRGLRSGLGIVLSNMGLACTRMGRRTEAERWFRQGRDLLEQLLKDYPRHEGVQADLASLLNNYAAWCNQVPETREGTLPMTRRVLELRTALAEARPRDARRQADRAYAHQNLGLALRDADQLPEALHELQQAHELRAKLARENPRVLRHQVDLASSLVDLGAHHQHQNQLEQALNCFREARDIDDKLFQQDPNSPYLRRDLALNCFRVGTVLGALKLRQEEHQTLTRARQLQEVLVRIDPNSLDDRRDLSRTLNELAWNRLAVDHPEEVPPLMHAALKYMRLVMERTPQAPRSRRTISVSWRALAEAEKRLGHTRASADALRQCAKLWPDNAVELHRLARLLVFVADRVGSGKADLNADEEAERRRDLDDALGLLRQAIAHGFRDAAGLQKDKAFDSLRSEDGFRDLLRDLENQAPPAKP